MSMTPERIEEIKNVAGISDEWALEKIVNELLAALEESQQQIKELQEGNRSACESRDMAYRSRNKAIVTSNQHYKRVFFLNEGLIEALQTIARQREALEFYANQENWELPSFGRGHSKVTSDRGSKARELLEEWSDKA